MNPSRSVKLRDGDWMAFQRTLRRRKWIADDRWVDDTSAVATQLWQSASPRSSLYLTKSIFLDFDWKQIGTTTTVWQRYWPPRTDLVRLIATALRPKRIPLTFVGDLAPIDLLTFVTVACGGLGKDAMRLLPVRYGGLCDRALDTFIPNLKPGHTLTQLLIPMESRDAALWKMLQQLPIDWNDIVGPQSLAVLASSRMLCADGLFNKWLYPDHAAHSRRARRFLFEDLACVS